MPNLTNAKKALRHADKRHLMNLKRMREIKRLSKLIEKSLVAGADLSTEASAKVGKEMTELIRKFQKAVDKAVKTGSLKVNTANRAKSRLIARVRKAIKK